ncbi:MAG: prephenate dehydrogenase/arogenate dehydrogenase family protein [Chlorobi bacterium]|nr:prephenate dehydrogenase/arogenate dehydrogenase family protein [Chlorobiota bacterium]
MDIIGIIGLGLIGGSYGLALRKEGYRILGADRNPAHLKEALSLGLIDAPLREKDYPHLRGLILAVPVDVLPRLAAETLDKISPRAWVADAGSIKSNIARAIKDHPRRGRFVLSHPIAGTEYSGPRAAQADLFRGKMHILCDPADSDPDVFREVENLHRRLGMHVRYLPSDEHDRHIAYVSHLSHVSAFMLGKTVLDVEPDARNIFLMAGSGFASTVRLAKSAPSTWVPIFMENRRYLAEVLERYIENLKKFATLLARRDAEEMHRLLEEINRIGRILDRIK